MVMVMMDRVMHHVVVVVVVMEDRRSGQRRRGGETDNHRRGDQQFLKHVRGAKVLAVRVAERRGR